MAQLMPLPLTVSCFSKIQIGFTFLVPAHLGSPGKGAVKRARVCVQHFYITHTAMCSLTHPVVSGKFLFWGSTSLRPTPPINHFPNPTFPVTSFSYPVPRQRGFRDLTGKDCLGQLSLASLRGRLIKYQLRLG